MAKHRKQAPAEVAAAEATASGKKGLTRRDFVAKVGLTAAAVGVAGALPTVAASCGSSGSSSSGSSPGSSGASSGEPTVVRFVFAPDAVWNYMRDTGIVTKWEELYNMKIVNTTTWDETAWFIGGHADIASMGTYEVPMVAENAGKEFVNFGKYNHDRDSIYIKMSSPYKSMPDLKGKKIATSGTGGAMLMQRAMFKKLYNLDLRLGASDFNVVVQEEIAMPASLQKGAVDATLGAIDWEIPYMQTSQHNWLYPETPTDFEFYRANFDPAHTGVMSNLWVTTPAWLDANQHAAEGFNLMWQEGVNAWHANRKTIIQAYPDMFTVKDQAQLDWFLSYLDQHDNCVTSVYLDDAWIEGEKRVYALLKETGVIKESTPDPVFVAMASPSNAPPEAQPPVETPAPSPSA
jgi:hypothetical protein